MDVRDGCPTSPETRSLGRNTPTLSSVTRHGYANVVVIQPLTSATVHELRVRMECEGLRTLVHLDFELSEEILSAEQYKAGGKAF